MVWNKGLKGEEYKKHYSRGMGGQFKKGTDGWNKGKTGVYSQETRLKMRIIKLKNGYIDKKGYRMLRILGRHVFEHQLVWELNYGEIPKGYDIHHINGNKLDNKIDNLEILTKSEHTKKHWRDGKKHSFH